MVRHRKSTSGNHSGGAGFCGGGWDGAADRVWALNVVMREPLGEEEDDDVKRDVEEDDERAARLPLSSRTRDALRLLPARLDVGAVAAKAASPARVNGGRSAWDLVLRAVRRPRKKPSDSSDVSRMTGRCCGIPPEEANPVAAIELSA